MWPSPWLWVTAVWLLLGTGSLWIIAAKVPSRSRSRGVAIVLCAIGAAFVLVNVALILSPPMDS